MEGCPTSPLLVPVEREWPPSFSHCLPLIPLAATKWGVPFAGDCEQRQKGIGCFRSCGYGRGTPSTLPHGSLGRDHGHMTGPGGTRDICFLVLGWKCRRGGVLVATGVAGGWGVEREGASSPVSEPLPFESSLNTFSHCWTLDIAKISVFSWESSKDRAGEEGFKTPGDTLLG